MSKHHITAAEEVYAGGGFFGPMAAANGRNGAPINLPTQIHLGQPIALDADGLIAAATSTELPNATTITYTTADDGASPFDNAATPAPTTITTATGATASVWALDVARNITAAVTHASSVVAMTITITGYDYWKQKVVETLDIAATGTSQTAAGKKAIPYVESIAITSADNATTNTLNLGWGDVLGLPYRLAKSADLMALWVGTSEELASATVVVADATTASATTGDVRGTIDPNTALGSEADVYVWMLVADNSSANGLKGVDQYAG